MGGLGGPGKLPGGEVTLTKPLRQVGISEVKKAGEAIGPMDRPKGRRQHGMSGGLVVFPGI